MIKRSGFSLMEILIVVTLFSLAAVILSQTYVSFNRMHRNVSNLATVTQDMRFATEYLIRNVRNAEINFDAYPDVSTVASSTEVHLKSQNATTDVEVRTGGDCNDTPSSRCLAVSKDGGVTWTPITAKHVYVDFFGAYVRPIVSPFVSSGSGYLSDEQPLVTFSLRLKYLADNPRDNVSLQAQSSVSSRVYQR